MRIFYYIILAFISVFLRFIFLGRIPAGVSSEEAAFGIFLTHLSGQHITNLLLLRLPFAVLGLFSIYLFFLFIKKLTGNTHLAYISSFLLSITPWHIEESRIFSPGLVVFTLILIVFLILYSYLVKNAVIISKLLVLAGIILFTVSILNIPLSAKNDVDYQRNIAAKKLPSVVTEVFSNKLVESYRHREKIFFENLDFGNYFFSGYPRPRWGYEDYPKLFIAFLPFLMIGVIKSQKKELIIIVSLFSAYLLILTASGLTDPAFGLPILLIVIPLTAYGVSIFKKTGLSGVLVIFFALLLVFELSYFLVTYKDGISESRFSKRSVAYPALAQKLSVLSDPFKKIIITPRLKDSGIHIEFYTPEIYKKTGFNDPDMKKDSSPDTLYVGVLPFEASPSEPLYKKDGKWPEHVRVLWEIKDFKHNSDIVIYKLQI